MPLAPQRPRTLLLGLLAATLAAAGHAPAQAPPKSDQIGKTFAVPYKRTATNHYLVRVRINGKGPFNFLVDTGAPALFIGTAAAAAVGLEPDEDEFWTPVDRFEIEGGIRLEGLKARVDDPFQLEGMNALGLPGATIDGILGFTVLARFRMEFDPRSDRTLWTRLDYEPKEPFVPRDPAARRAPAEVEAMNLLGPAMKVLAALAGKQPADTLEPQGILGVLLDEVLRDGRTLVVVRETWPGSPAEAAGLARGDRIASIDGKPVDSLASAHEAVAHLRPGKAATFAVQRGDLTLDLTLTATDGL
jgi:hypothetical protein